MFFRRMATAAFTLTLAFSSIHAQTPAQKAQTSRDEAEIQAYTLTMDTITRLIQATHEFSQLKPKGDEKKDDDGDNQDSLDQQAARLSKYPPIVAILAKYGFTPRKYVTAFTAYLFSGIAIAGLDAGASMDDMVTKAHMNPANIKLIREHKAEIDALTEKYPMKNSSE